MHNRWAELYGELPDEIVKEIEERGELRELPAGSVLMQEGAPIGSLFIVFEGLFEVRIAALDDQSIARLGYGQFVGEMSFIDASPASATVVAVEPSRVLELPHTVLQGLLVQHPAVAAAVYRVLARLSAQRLRETMGHLGRQVLAAVEARGEYFAPVKQLLVDLQAVFTQADDPATTDAQILDLAARAHELFAALHTQFDALAGHGSARSETVHAVLGGLVQDALKPYLVDARSVLHVYLKPRGYAGDFQSIELIYQNQALGEHPSGRLLDSCFQALPAAQAVRNRRHLLRREIAATIAAAPAGQRARVTSLASGPAREICDLLEDAGLRAEVEFTLVDMDQGALDFAAGKLGAFDPPVAFQCANKNLIHLAVGRGSFPQPPQDLIYSIGLIDYFPDTLVVKLLNFIHDQLAAGGRVILGNFHPDNPTRAMMDHVLDWRLIHRDEAKMNALFRASKFGRPCTRFQYEEQRINLFAECVREA
ncbi:MAG: cyclic nucleotide-binding domain-containing protein [Pseudomonadota bacterium]